MMNTRRLILVGLAVSFAASALIVVIPAVGSSPPSAESQVGALTGGSLSQALATDSVPSGISGTMAMLPGADADQGSPVSSDVHELMSGLGLDHAGLYAYPTTSGSVCVVATEPVPVGTCVDTFDQPTTPIAVDVYSEVGVPPSVMGIAPNDVTGVEVVVNGVDEPATVSDNGVYYQAPAGTSADAITGVVAEYADGTSETQPFKPAVEAPPTASSGG
jgi:hypothetical protein